MKSRPTLTIDYCDHSRLVGWYSFQVKHQIQLTIETKSHLPICSLYPIERPDVSGQLAPSQQVIGFNYYLCNLANQGSLITATQSAYIVARHKDSSKVLSRHDITAQLLSSLSHSLLGVYGYVERHNPTDSFINGWSTNPLPTLNAVYIKPITKNVEPLRFLSSQYRPDLASISPFAFGFSIPLSDLPVDWRTETLCIYSDYSCKYLLDGQNPVEMTPAYTPEVLSTVINHDLNDLTHPLQPSLNQYDHIIRLLHDISLKLS